MPNVFTKSERIVRTALALLERDSVLSGLVWRDAGGDFRGAKNDTITIRLPAYAKANKRALRSGDARTISTLHERRVDVTLDTDLYQRVEITDEELTLDIDSFEAQVVVPTTGALLRGLEDEIIDEAQGATYQVTVTFDPNNPYGSAVDARKALNNARVPADSRALILGSELEALFLNDDKFVRADQSGSTDTLRNAQIGRVAGFPVFTIPGLDPDEGYAFHRTAYVLSSRAPMVPTGARGSTLAAGSFALRAVQVLDPNTIVDNFHLDVFAGTNHVEDFGKMVNGKFEPGLDPESPASGEANRFVRAVKLTLGS